jgi:hypothetical protein
MLTSLTLGGVVLSMLFWAALPVTTPHPHECCKKPDVKAEPLFKPLETLNKDEKMIAQLEVQIDALEKQKAEAEKDKGKGKKAGSEAAAPAPKKKP